jgi:glucokinase
VFEDAIKAFLKDIKPTDFPKCAAIGIAGPVSKNTVSLANVGKWGLLNGDQLAISLKIPNFQFLNDFEAASYGILTLPE